LRSRAYIIRSLADTIEKGMPTMLPISRRRLLAAALACYSMSAMASQTHAATAATSASVEVDARDAPRGIERTHLILPVKPGKLTLLYPKWLPGDHSPDGPVAGISGLKFSGNGQAIAWQRDLDNMYAFHLTIPAGVTSLDVTFEVDAVLGATDNNAPRTATESLALILWNQLVLYPAGSQSDDLQYSAKLRLPAGWAFGTALPQVGAAGDGTQFAQVSLTTLIDSPVLSGRHFKTVELGGTPAVYLHLAADSDAAVEIPAATTGQLRKLVAEAAALFGATHYNEYHFLWTLSDQIGFEGIEHHQSSDNRTAERSLIDEDLRRSSGVMDLLPHEYVHSWNGKYRRPIGLATGNYDAPMRGDLLWVYEGLTQYLGMVLSARSGIASPEDARNAWAGAAAGLQTHKGREWRSLEDTAIGAQIGYTLAPEWRSRTRGNDFYLESAMLWLEADTLIRSTTHGAKSLDDFCRLFYGPPSTAPKVIAYDFNDVVKALNAVMPYDWRGFWTAAPQSSAARCAARRPRRRRLAGGIRPEPTAVEKGDDVMDKTTDLNFSLGFRLKDEAAVISSVVSARRPIRRHRARFEFDCRRWPEILQGGAARRLEGRRRRDAHPALAAAEGRDIQHRRAALRRSCTPPAAGARSGDARSAHHHTQPAHLADGGRPGQSRGRHRRRRHGLRARLLADPARARPRRHGGRARPHLRARLVGPVGRLHPPAILHPGEYSHLPSQHRVSAQRRRRACRSTATGLTSCCGSRGICILRTRAARPICAPITRCRKPAAPTWRCCSRPSSLGVLHG
jgi:predicted metalloprotease with PDZ domain